MLGIVALLVVALTNQVLNATSVSFNSAAPIQNFSTTEPSSASFFISSTLKFIVP
ncbi:MAG: hypothetical protein K2L48_03330 [Mycoplasmoidaceae bacterium]|nr:hypothetical protein [Mycoplasmoidaceae bacterium]